MPSCFIWDKILRTVVRRGGEESPCRAYFVQALGGLQPSPKWNVALACPAATRWAAAWGRSGLGEACQPRLGCARHLDWRPAPLDLARCQGGTGHSEQACSVHGGHAA